MASAGVEYAGPLDGLVVALQLSLPEMRDLAYAFTFEERRKEAELIPEILGTVNSRLGGAIDLLDDVPPETFGGEDDYFRAKRAIAKAGGLVAEAQRRARRAWDRPSARPEGRES